MEKNTQNIDWMEKIKAETKSFKAKEYELSTYSLLKKTQIENTSFIVFETKRIVVGEKEYYNFRCLNEVDTPFCFNGSSILKSQLDDFGLPCKVKLIKVLKPLDKLRPFYWTFTEAD